MPLPLSTSHPCSSTFTVAAHTDHLGLWPGLFKMGLALAMAQEKLREDSLHLLKNPSLSCILGSRVYRLLLSTYAFADHIHQVVLIALDPSISSRPSFQ